MFKTEVKDRGFQLLPTDRKKCWYYRIMFDRYYCLTTQWDVRKSKIFDENEPVNLYFLWFKARRNGTFTACVLKTPLPGQGLYAILDLSSSPHTNVMLTSRFYVCYCARYLHWRQGPECFSILLPVRLNRRGRHQTGFESRLSSPLESKKISNYQELIQSDPTSCPQKQKGNN